MSIQKTKYSLFPFNRSSFTLMEICIVGIVLAAIAGLAYNNFKKVNEQSLCRTAQTNLILFYNASILAYYKKYLPTSTINGLAAINTALKVNVPNDPYTSFVYQYLRPSADRVDIISTRSSGGPSYSCTITFMSLNPLSPSNPSCTDSTYCSSIMTP